MNENKIFIISNVFQLWQTRSLAGVSPESWNEIDNNWQKVEAQVNIFFILKLCYTLYELAFYPIYYNNFVPGQTDYLNLKMSNKYNLKRVIPHLVNFIL
jgi:hypothetical protein